MMPSPGCRGLGDTSTIKNTDLPNVPLPYDIPPGCSKLFGNSRVGIKARQTERVVIRRVSVFDAIGVGAVVATLPPPFSPAAGGHTAMLPPLRGPRATFFCGRQRVPCGGLRTPRSPLNLCNMLQHGWEEASNNSGLGITDGLNIRLSKPPEVLMLCTKSESKLMSDTIEMPVEPAAPPPKRSHGKWRPLTLDSLDRRTAAARRAHELITAIEADLGGAANLSEGARQIVQHAAVLGTYIESCEAEWLSGKPIPLLDLLAAQNAQRRLLLAVDITRQARDITADNAEMAELFDAYREGAAS
jgi:hypothetical protein